MPAGISLAKATEMAADLRKAVREFPEVSYIVTQLGSQRRRHRSLDAVAHRGERRASPLRHLAGGRNASRILIQRMAERFREHAGIRRRLQPADDRRRQRQDRRRAQPARRQDLRRRLRRNAPNRQGDRRCARSRCPGPPMLPSTRSRRCRRSPIKVDREAAARYGINVADISDLIRDRNWRRGREPGLHRRPPLRHDRPVSSEARRGSPKPSAISCSRRAAAR